MTGIFAPKINSSIKSVTIDISMEMKYRILTQQLPWEEMASIANIERAKTVDINNGRPLNLRLHLGAYLAQSMNGWTDRETEEMVRFHAGIRVLCGINGTEKTLDHTSIETFRNSLGKEGAENLNQVALEFITLKGFTSGEICSSDTTVQEAPIAYPTEVGHLKNISGKLLEIGRKIKKGIAEKLINLQGKVMDIFTEIRLFTKGKKEKVIEKKKELSRKLFRKVKLMKEIVKKAAARMTKKSKMKYQENIDFYSKMLGQIIKWIETGIHPRGKIISLWNQGARAITRDKAAKATEFGRRWIITRLMNGYIMGRPCHKLGGDADTGIAEEVLPQFLDMFGKVPDTFVYDRGGDGPINHQMLGNVGVKNIAIFRKGKNKMEVPKKIFKIAKRERALTEASIATIKASKYGFNKPRAKSEEGCISKGHIAILGANLNKLSGDLIFGLKM